MRKPNIVLVFVDNQPADMMGCYGNDEIHTPNLDRVAGEGLLFRNAFCPNAMCSPCRASVLTGLMPSQHGVHTWLDDYEIQNWPSDWNALDEFETLPEILKTAGYDTALIGKYHVGVPDRPQNGFDYWLTFGIGHFSTFYDLEVIDNGDKYVVPEHSVDFLTRKAVDYIEGRRAESDTPFFLFLTYNAPYGHWPIIKGEPTNRFADRYRDCPMNSVPREGLSRDLIDWITLRMEKMPGEEEDYYKSLAQVPNDLPSLRNYYSQETIVDEGVGRIINTLDRNNMSEETLFIYTADHGMSLGRHGFWGHGEDTWPSNTHRQAHNIPLLIRQPNKVNRGIETQQFVGTTDLFPTILEHVGIGSSSTHGSSGRSLTKLFDDGTSDGPQVVFMEQEETRAIRTPDCLYMKRFGPSPYELQNALYNLSDDPDERTNLAGNPDFAAIEDELSNRIDKFFRENAHPKWDLWHGGTVKSNSTRPFFWREVWGEQWQPTY